jgi:hypothetical protein
MIRREFRRFQRGKDAVLVGGNQWTAGAALILLVILLTSSHKVMGKRVNSPLLRYLGGYFRCDDCGSGGDDPYI